MTGRRPDWGAIYETLADCMGAIQSVADSMMPDYPNPYDREKGLDLIDGLAEIYVNAVNNYNWPESRIWEKWQSYIEWDEHNPYSEGSE